MLIAAPVCRARSVGGGMAGQLGGGGRPGVAGGFNCLAGTSSAAGGQQVGEERFDAGSDLVADRADGGDAEAGGVVEFPVLVAFAGEDRAGVAAPHGDDDV